MGQKPLADGSVGKALKFAREAAVIEDMTTRTKNQIECLQMQRVGVGQRAVDVEQQRSS